MNSITCFQESGLIEHWFAKDRYNAARRSVTKFRPLIAKVSMEAVQAPVLMSLCFLIPAVVSFTFEVIVGGRRGKRKPERENMAPNRKGIYL